MALQGNSITTRHLITAGDMSQASLTTPALNVQDLGRVGLALMFTGTPTGTFSVNVSLDYNGVSGGTWIPLTLSPAPVASGAANQIYIDLTVVTAPWLQVVYTKTSGTGTLDVYASAKAF
ncbi:MAG: hypothetical protein NVS3B25_09970 [Hymenobacter sp.]